MRKSQSSSRSRGFTLIEIMVATALTLLLMASVASMFAFVTNSITDSRAVIEMTETLRQAATLLQNDLTGATAPTTPPLNPDQGYGYFEIIEGPIGPVYHPLAINLSHNGANNAPAVSGTYTVPGDTALWPVDESFDDVDDILMLTTASPTGNFTGDWTDLISGTDTVMAAPQAEVCWFLRGTTLFRRQLLIVPGIGTVENNDLRNASGNTIYTARTFYKQFDLSMRQDGGQNDSQQPAYGLTGAGNGMPIVRSNSLGDLTKRENRYGHQPFRYPHDARFWGRVLNGTGGQGNPMPGMGLPILLECSQKQWPFPLAEISSMSTSSNPLTQSMLQYPVNSMSTASGSQLRSIVSPIMTSTASGALPPHTISGTSGDPNSAHFDLITLAANSTYQPIAGATRTGAYSSAATLAVQSLSTGLAHNLNFFSSGSDDDRYDDIVMTNVVSFDVKVWDPGAPVFDVPVPALSTGTAVASSISTSIGPGDAGYNNILFNAFITPNPPVFNAGSARATNVSFGAYADLNYMQRVTNLDAYNPIFRSLTSAPATLTTTPTSTTYPVMTSKNNYELSLRRYENSLGLPIGSLPRPHFSGPGDPRSGVYGLWPGHQATMLKNVNYPTGANLPAAIGEATTVNRPIASVYDTWSTHYERDGLANNLDNTYGVGAGTTINPFYNGGRFTIDPLYNGIDDDGINGIDDAGEAEAPPPYPHPLRGIQIKIRCFEADTKQIREITVTHKFIRE